MFSHLHGAGLHQMYRTALAVEEEARRAEEAGQYEKATAGYAKAVRMFDEYARLVESSQQGGMAIRRARAIERRLQQLKEPRQRENETNGGGNDESFLQDCLRKPQVTRERIAGLDHILDLVERNVTLAADPSPQAQALAARTITLAGTAGGGKTLIAEYIAGRYAPSRFLSVSGGNLMNSLVGESERRIMVLLREITSSSEPTVLFLDEADALLRDRSNAGASGSGVERRIISQFLVGLNNIPRRPNGPLVLTASNRPMDWDSAILRRIGEEILYIPLPEESARHDILLRALDEVTMQAAGQDLRWLAQQTQRYSAADLFRLVRAAGREAFFQSSGQASTNSIQRSHLAFALKRIRPSVSQREVEELEAWVARHASSQPR